MCITTRPAVLSKTHILVSVSPTHVTLLYQMIASTPETETTMVLPIPAKTCEYVDASEYPEFFSDLAMCFEEPTRGGRAPLEVVTLGSYLVTHVPTKNDIDRLDPRFTIPKSVFDSYDDSWSYVAFKLTDLAGTKKIHPMGVRYPRSGDLVVFPTLHFHGDQFETTEEYDHTLYLQCATGKELRDWDWVHRRGYVKPCSFFDWSAGAVFERSLRGDLPNVDHVFNVSTNKFGPR